MIEGVQLIDLVRHEDDRGFLYEILHATDDFFWGFGQNYLASSPLVGTIRALHRHTTLREYFHTIRGSAKFCVALEGGSDEVQVETYILSERQPRVLVIPPGIWHGWMSLEPHTTVLGTGSAVYNPASPDEERIPPDAFGDIWKVKGR
jgi:dTDP-4-dehydrorhamnose 3,5-epimerase